MSTELQNSIRNSFTSYVEVNRTFSTLNAVDKYLIRQFTDKLERSYWRLSNRHSVGDVERLRLSTSPTFAAVVVEPTTNRAHASSPDKTLLYNYTRRRQLRPVADLMHGSDHVPPSPTHHRRHGLLTPRLDLSPVSTTRVDGPS